MYFYSDQKYLNIRLNQTENFYVGLPTNKMFFAGLHRRFKSSDSCIQK